MTSDNAAETNSSNHGSATSRMPRPMLHLFLLITIVGSFIFSALSVRFMRINSCLDTDGQWLADEFRCLGSTTGEELALFSLHSAIEVLIQAALFWVLLIVVLSPAVLLIRHFVNRRRFAAQQQRTSDIPDS